jgi:hypothetical protein
MKIVGRKLIFQLRKKTKIKKKNKRYIFDYFNNNNTVIIMK